MVSEMCCRNVDIATNRQQLCLWMNKGTWDAPENAPRTPIGMKGTKCDVLKWGKPVAKTNAITARFPMVTMVLNRAPDCVPAASTPHRVNTRIRAGMSMRQYCEPVLIRKMSASLYTKEPKYDVKARAIAAALRMYSDARDVADILQAMRRM